MDKNWKFSRLGVLFIVLVFHCLCSCSSLNDEGLTLLRFKERIVSDPFGALTNWRSSDTENDPCSWFGVGCSDGKVVILNLKDLCLEGALVPELTSLTQIKSIILRNNLFTGIIPEGFGDLKELEVLDLGFNNFSGPLPNDLGINHSLAILLLDNNELLGSLSPEIYELQILSESQVDESQLSNAAKKGSSCTKKSITWNRVHTEDTVHRRVLQDVVPFNNFGVDIPTSPPPSASPSSTPIPPASVAPTNNTEGNATSSAPNVSAPTPSPSALTPSLSPSNPPLLTPSQRPQKSGQSSSKHLAIVGGAVGGAILFVAIIGIYLFRSNKVSTVKPWATGLSGQLQKAFVTGKSSFSDDNNF